MSLDLRTLRDRAWAVATLGCEPNQDVARILVL
jgi:hypothetical protein